MKPITQEELRAAGKTVASTDGPLEVGLAEDVLDMMWVDEEMGVMDATALLWGMSVGVVAARAQLMGRIHDLEVELEQVEQELSDERDRHAV